MTLQDFIQSANSLFCPAQKGLLAVSGGVDSAVLCHLMHQAGFPFAIAHCNFHLRPGDCDRDEAFVRSLAERYGVEIHVAQFDTEAYAQEHHLSIEEAARNLRYGFFEDLGFDYIATAHHRDDSAETFFINLLRGTGIAGLHGIPARNGRVVRPLLPFSRQEIEAYAEDQGLEHVEDCTNATTLYLRNKIRHQLLPLLRQIDPHADLALQRTMAHLADTEQVYRQHIDELRSHLLREDPDGTVHLSIADIDALSPRRTLLFELLRPYGFTAPQIDDILRDLHRPSGAVYTSPTHRLFRDRGELVSLPCLCLASALPLPCLCLKGTNTAVSWQGQGTHTVRLLEAPVELRRDPNVAYFDAAKVQQPLSLRTWREGDRFRPFGMKGSQLVSDYFSDHKFSRLQRERTPLLVDAAGTILWIVGHRAAHIPVTSTTTSVLEVTYGVEN